MPEGRRGRKGGGAGEAGYRKGEEPEAKGLQAKQARSGARPGQEPGQARKPRRALEKPTRPVGAEGLRGTERLASLESLNAPLSDTRPSRTQFGNFGGVLAK